MPLPDDIFATLAGGKHFTTLDLSHAYNQVLLAEDSHKFVMINTHRGLYRNTRLHFGIASAPTLFQRVMDKILQDIPGTMCYLDDVIITGASMEDHCRNLAEVLGYLHQFVSNKESVSLCNLVLNIWVIR